jgi:hypothetical protein
MRGFMGSARGTGVLLAVAVSAYVSASCGSSGTGPSTNGDLHLSLKANGTTVEYTVQASLYAAFSNSGNQYNALITGYNAVGGVGLQIFSDSAIGVGSYSGYDISNGALKGIIIGYTDASNVSYVTGAQQQVVGTIAITSMTSTRVAGTFSGTVSATGHPDITITDGEFVVQRAN